MQGDFDTSLSVTMNVPAAVVQPRHGTAREYIERSQVAARASEGKRAARKRFKPSSFKDRAALKRERKTIADPAVNSPVVEPLSNIVGFTEFTERLTKRREADEAFAALPAHEQYAEAGMIDGVKLHGRHGLEIVVSAD